MRSGWLLVWLAAVCLPLASCHWIRGANSCPQGAYVNARTEPPLKVPPGLDAPDTTNALRLPQLNEPAPPPRKPKDPCLDYPPSFKVNQPKPAPQA